MFLPPFFWQDVGNSSKEMFVEHFLLRKKWKTRFKDYILVIIMMGLIVMYEKSQAYLAYICFPESNPTKPSPFQSPSVLLWIWILLTIFVCVTAESASIVDSVLKKFKHKRNERQLKSSSAHARAA